MAKINNVTDTDIELLIKSGEDVAARAMDFNQRIFDGKVEPLEEPLRKAVELLATSRTLADLAARIINNSAAIRDEQAGVIERQLWERADADTK